MQWQWILFALELQLLFVFNTIRYKIQGLIQARITWVTSFVSTESMNDWKWVLRKHCCCASFNGSCRSVHYFTIYQGVNHNLEWLHLCIKNSSMTFGNYKVHMWQLWHQIHLIPEIWSQTHAWLPTIFSMNLLLQELLCSGWTSGWLKTGQVY